MAQRKHKDWFDAELARSLADKIAANERNFDQEGFVTYVTERLPPLELKARVATFADGFEHFLPGPFAHNAEILTSILGPENEEETGMFTNFYWVMPVANYVEQYGLEDFEAAMQLTEAVTKRNTAEYCIRPYLQKYPDRTMRQMRQWASDKNFHLRRLASEGVRPRLPWATKLDQFVERPHPILPILEQLRDDPIRYVQTSVANCLNDILKDHPALVRDILQRWATDRPTEHRKWIIRHALRRGRKAKDPWTLNFLGWLDSAN